MKGNTVNCKCLREANKGCGHPVHGGIPGIGGNVHYVTRLKTEATHQNATRERQNFVYHEYHAFRHFDIFY